MYKSVYNATSTGTSHMELSIECVSDTHPNLNPMRVQCASDERNIRNEETLEPVHLALRQFLRSWRIGRDEWLVVRSL
jgi:hypothetical protein